jgi:hypothetical protein
MLDFLKALGGGGVVAILVRMVLLGQLAVGLLDLIGGGVTCHTQHFVQIPLGHGLAFAA